MSTPDITVMGYGDLGSLVGQTLTNLGEGLHQEGMLQSILCRDVKKTSLPQELVIRPLPFGNIIPKGMKGISRYIYEYDSRGLAEQLFDKCAARHLSTDVEILYCYIPGYVRSLNAVGEIPTVVQTGTELAMQAQNRRLKELRRLGVDVEATSPTRHHQRRLQSLQEADHIVAQSEFVLSSLESIDIDTNKIQIIPPGVDTVRFTPASRDKGEEFTALFVGEINVLKGIPYLLDAWSTFGEGLNKELVMCGRTSASMKKLLHRWDLTDVRRPGFVDPLSYYQEASVFVFPSLSDGFGKAPLEAMSCGCPVIVTENTGVADLITDGDDGYVIPAGDAEAIRNRLDHLSANPGERKRMGQKARKTAEQYDWDRYVREVVEYLGSEVGSENPTATDGGYSPSY